MNSRLGSNWTQERTISRIDDNSTAADVISSGPIDPESSSSAPHSSSPSSGVGGEGEVAKHPESPLPAVVIPSHLDPVITLPSDNWSPSSPSHIENSSFPSIVISPSDSPLSVTTTVLLQSNNENEETSKSVESGSHAPSSTSPTDDRINQGPDVHTGGSQTPPHYFNTDLTSSLSSSESSSSSELKPVTNPHGILYATSSQTSDGETLSPTWSLSTSDTFSSGHVSPSTTSSSVSGSSVVSIHSIVFI